MMAPAMRRDAWIALSLAAIVCAIWTPSLHGSFQFDDWNVIVHESRVHSISAWWQSMPGIRPVLKLSYALNYELGSGVVGFRFVNVALHACNAVLVFLLLQLLSREIPLTGARESTSTRTTLAAATAALLFALHPVQSDAVTYISGRSSVLAGSFSLLALFLWARGPTRLNWLSLACFALALGVKETALALPLIVTLWWAVGRSARHSTNGADMYSLRQVLAPYLLVAAALVIIAATLTPYPQMIASAAERRTIDGNLLTQANGVSYLLGQTLLVREPNADPALPYVGTLNSATALRGLMLLALLALGCALFKRRPAWSFSILWFFAWLAPTNSFIPRVDAVFDRQLYLALIGPAWLVARSLASARWRIGAAIGLLASMGLIALFARQTLSRHAAYENEIVFWQDVLVKSPANARAANNLGMAYAAACNTTAALEQFASATRLAPEDPYARVNAALLRHGKLDGVPADCQQSHAAQSTEQ